MAQKKFEEIIRHTENEILEKRVQTIETEYHNRKRSRNLTKSVHWRWKTAKPGIRKTWKQRMEAEAVVFHG